MDVYVCNKHMNLKLNYIFSIPIRSSIHIIIVVPETTAYSRWNCQMSTTSANCCQFIPRNRATVFPALGQVAAAELTHHSLKPLRLPYASRLRLSLLLAGDVHPNPGPATQYPCAVCVQQCHKSRSQL